MPRVRSHVRQGSAQTRDRLLDATTRLLTTQGFAAATTRSIGEAAGANAALVSYHYGSLNQLLLAALDASSEARLAEYRRVVEEAGSVRALRAATRQLYAGDRASGHVRLLAEMIAGGLMDRSLGAEVAARVEPWVELVEDVITRLVPTAALRRRIPAREIAFGVVAMFLGLELLGALTGDYRRGDAVVARLTSGRTWGTSK